MGGLTADEVRVFQARHKNHLGLPLRIDGDLGPQTRWAMDLETLVPERIAIVRAAQQHLDLIEDPPGSNSDPAGLIQGWLKACGAKSGDAWCAAYASHCLSFGLGRRIREAGALKLGELFAPTANPIAGDLAGFATGGGFGHIFIIAGVAPIGTLPREVMGIEGNCNNSCCCTRRPFDELRFWRTVPDVSGRCPGVITKNVPLITRGKATTR